MTFDNLPTPDAVAGLEEVARAWRSAARLSADNQSFRVGVCSSDGEVIAAVMLDSFIQVLGFSRRLEKLGYAPMRILGEAQQLQGCDVILLPRDRTNAQQG